MTAMKVSELKGAELDYWVYIATFGFVNEKTAKTEEWKEFITEELLSFHPSTNWQQGGELIEKYRVTLESINENVWSANMFFDEVYQHGETPLIAAMRCIVASKYGDEVSE